MLPNFSYFRAATVADAVKALSEEGARLHAGGTDLLSCMRDGVLTAERVVSIRDIPSLRGIRRTSVGGLRIGAMTTVAEVAAHPSIRDRYTALAMAASEVASPQLRNQGTLGGNLCQKPRCWYYRGEFHCLRKGGGACYAVGGENQFHCILGGAGCYIVHPSDTAPALAALDAVLTVAGPGGNSRQIPVSGFHMPPNEDPARETRLSTGEIVTEIILPPPKENLRSAYRKVRARRSWDFALAGAALALAIDGSAVTDARVVLSGAAPVPWRAVKTEVILNGRSLDGDVIGDAAAAAVADAMPLSENAYKISLIKGMLTEELEKMAAG